jgi:hypothetical protein
MIYTPREKEIWEDKEVDEMINLTSESRNGLQASNTCG